MNELLQDKLDNTNRNFKGQQKTEEVLAFCRKHWITISFHIFSVILFGIATIAYFVIFKDFLTDLMSENLYRIFAFIIGIITAFFLHRIFLRLLNYYLQIVIITNYRIVVLNKTLFFTDDRDAIDLPEIQDIVMHKNGIFQSILNYGQLDIILSAVNAPRILSYIPNPDYHFRKINKTKREYILQRQFLKQAGGSVRQEPKPEGITTQIPNNAISVQDKL